MIRPGLAGHGLSWSDMATLAWHALAWHALALLLKRGPGLAWPGLAWPSMVSREMSWHVGVWPGWPGMAWLCNRPVMLRAEKSAGAFPDPKVQAKNVPQSA